MKNRELTINEYCLFNSDFSDSFIWSRLSANDQGRLGLSSSLSQSLLDKAGTRKLIQYVVYGDQANAEKLIKAKPRLLLLAADEVVDYSDRSMKNVTAFQAALRSQDINMLHMMRPYFNKIKNGLTVMAKQYQAELPHIQFAQNQPAFDFTEIADCITKSSEAEIEAALAKKKNDTLLCQTLIQFRHNFTAQSLTELHFNPQHLLKAFAVYADHNNHAWSDEQCLLFWRQVIGYVQRYLPACYAQAFSQGLYEIVEQKKDLQRRLEFRANPGSYFFPLSCFNTNTRLGYDYAVALTGSELGKFECRRPSSSGLERLTKLCQTKTEVLEKIKQQLQQRSNQEDIVDNNYRCRCHII